MQDDAAQEHLERLRKSRSLPKPDLSLGFLSEQFKREVAKPYKQLGDLSALWVELLPASLAEKSRLVGLSRGTLHVEADNPAVRYEIDRLLRGGVQKQIINRHKGPAFRKLAIKVLGRNDAEPVDPKRLPPAGDTNARLKPERQPARGKAGLAGQDG